MWRLEQTRARLASQQRLLVDSKSGDQPQRETKLLACLWLQSRCCHFCAEGCMYPSLCQPSQPSSVLETGHARTISAVPNNNYCYHHLLNEIIPRDSTSTESRASFEYSRAEIAQILRGGCLSPPVIDESIGERTLIGPCTRRKSTRNSSISKQERDDRDSFFQPTPTHSFAAGTNPRSLPARRRSARRAFAFLPPRRPQLSFPRA